MNKNVYKKIEISKKLSIVLSCFRYKKETNKICTDANVKCVWHMIVENNCIFRAKSNSNEIVLNTVHSCRKHWLRECYLLRSISLYLLFLNIESLGQFVYNFWNSVNEIVASAHSKISMPLLNMLRRFLNTKVNVINLTDSDFEMTHNTNDKIICDVVELIGV